MADDKNFFRRDCLRSTGHFRDTNCIKLQFLKARSQCWSRCLWLPERVLLQKLHCTHHDLCNFALVFCNGSIAPAAGWAGRAAGGLGGARKIHGAVLVKVLLVQSTVSVSIKQGCCFGFIPFCAFSLQVLFPLSVHQQ